MNTGVVYIASGNKYIEEARQSAKTLKKQMPEMKTTLISSKNITDPNFEQVIVIDNPQYSLLDKVKYMADTPYDYTLFLDTDTFIYEPVYELFILLEKFDIAVAHEQTRISYSVPEIPNSFPEMNTGVILFKKSLQIKKLFQDWLNFYERDLKKIPKPKHDQPAFREAIYKNSENLRLMTLIPEYNCRIEKAVFIQSTVKIFHMHAKPERMNLPDLAAYINQKNIIRVYVPGLGLVSTKRWKLRIHTRHLTIVLPMHLPRVLGWFSYRFQKSIKKLSPKFQ